eukprot:Protomagalhaensia_sp_Gyna_25__5155@NODE_607_length_3022_cov_517_312772_g470_i0_p1_GENE_NODE_607_length_3022_cov_517_312772_g470_i0NODE_607_length_3022_cov_517_312772_g470_i0_p1_ORF_typecomplete_len789_score189_37tRNAsynt_2b/PF00587_25/5_6e03tRNAsynt_2b/PF00587_25/4_5e43tRNAsynt_2b/PF00587_25/0_2HGTP_anticodon/PF03129_20/2e16tRNA_SAD/PF07973_14/1_8e09TGS/PF02824_21/4_2e09_NODE_607_length_3022_cov_517_312772_g470_i06052971
MAVRRAYEGTIPVLEPGTKVGGAVQIQGNGSAGFIAERDAVFQELYQAQEARLAELPREPIVIKLRSGDAKPGVSNHTTPYEVAAAISGGLAKSSLVARVRFHSAVEDTVADTERDVAADDESVSEDADAEGAADNSKVLWDMHRPLPASCDLEFLKWDSSEARHCFWHSAAHLLGLALEQTLGVQLTIGIALQKGFYYDCFCGDSFSIGPEHCDLLKKAAEKFASAGHRFERLELSKEEALVMFRHNPFKVALIAAKVPENGRTSAYRCGPFVDLCTGPHLPTLGAIKAFDIEKHSSAYWLGDARGDSLQRVYGIAFPDSKLMKEHKALIEEAKKRDHRVLGNSLNLFFFDTNYSPGCCFWTPDGAKIYNKLQDLMRSEYRFRGFQEVVSPNLFSCDLFKTSGHYQNYKDCMFIMDVEGKEWGMKPMNCPGHCCIFKHLAPSYRQLPLRMADFGVLHRNEFGGSLSGLTRVRRFQQDDAHIFCTLEQVTAEVSGCLDFLCFIYRLFGFTFQFYLATRPEKALGTVELWDRAEAQLKEALDASGMPWKLNRGDGAFYGPKIDIKLFDALGRGHQCGTVQLDFQLPLRFDLQYKTAINVTAEGETENVEVTDKDTTGTEPNGAIKPDTMLKNPGGSLESELKLGYDRPVMIHRAILGSIERFTAVLLEHTGGRLPFWISPRQAIVCPISEKNHKYASYVRDVLHTQGFDVGVDLSNNTINKKIREAQVHQWNFILVVGAAEEEHQTVMLRIREDPKNQTEKSLADLIAQFEELRDVTKRRFTQIPPFQS